MRSDIHPQVNEKFLKKFLFQKNHSKDSTAYIFKIILIQQSCGETEVQKVNNLPNIIILGNLQISSSYLPNISIARMKLGPQTIRLVLQVLNQKEFPNTKGAYSNLSFHFCSTELHRMFRTQIQILLTLKKKQKQNTKGLVTCL